MRTKTVTSRKVKNLFKSIVVLLVISMMCLLITGCGHSLSGKYTSESGVYSIKFSSNGKCTWYQGGSYFNGSYYWDGNDNCYYIEIMGNGFYSNTTFIAVPSSDDLVISGGTVNHKTFIKQSGSDSGGFGIGVLVFILLNVFVGGGVIVLVIVLTRKNKKDVIPTVTNSQSNRVVVKSGCFCPNCGLQHDSSQNFCRKCGTKLK